MGDYSVSMRGARQVLSKNQQRVFDEIAAGKKHNWRDEMTIQTLIDVGLVWYAEDETFKLTWRGQRQADKKKTFSGEGVA